MVRSECFDTCEMQLFRKGTLTQVGGFGFVFSISGSFVALPSIASLGQIRSTLLSWDDSKMFCHHEPEVDVSNTIKNPKKLDGHLKGFTHWHFAGAAGAKGTRPCGIHWNPHLQLALTSYLAFGDSFWDANAWCCCDRKLALALHLSM